MEQKTRTGWPRLVLWLVKWLSAFLLSFVLAVLGMSLMDYGTWSFIFIFLAAQTFYWKLFHKSGLISVLLFDAGFVFLILILRLYIIVGPTL